MAVDRRKRNADWRIIDESGNAYDDYHPAILATLMDIREELQKLNGLLHCRNFVGIPTTLRTISRKLAKPRKGSR